mmetsp:Transcript_5181/g.12464  ORF Transcript_5181/g.12464 Transcript_5181/m.12464 type:complete len:223 (+) Transcript_5181:59-727(+)
MNMEDDLIAQIEAKAASVERLGSQREALAKAVRKAESEKVISEELATVLARVAARPAVVQEATSNPCELSPELSELQERKRALQERIADAKAALAKATLPDQAKTPDRKRHARVSQPSHSRRAEFMTVRKAEQGNQMLAVLHKEIQRRELQKGWESVSAMPVAPRQKTHRDKEVPATAPKSLLGQTLDKIAAENAEVDALASNLDLHCQAFSYRFQTIRDMK